jgi:5-methylcytosine-specific restriction protein A
MRLCSGPGCGHAIPEDEKFCEECRAERAPQQTEDVHEHTSGYTAELDALRKSARWQRVRARAMKRDPICKRCERRMSEIVDHVVPAHAAVQQARDSGKFPFDKYAGYFLLSNLQGLCRPCHYAKTMEDKTHVGEWPDVVERELARPKKVWRF